MGLIKREDPTFKNITIVCNVCTDSFKSYHHTPHYYLDSSYDSVDVTTWRHRLMFGVDTYTDLTLSTEIPQKKNKERKLNKASVVFMIFSFSWSAEVNMRPSSLSRSRKPPALQLPEERKQGGREPFLSTSPRSIAPCVTS